VRREALERAHRDLATNPLDAARMAEMLLFDGPRRLIVAQPAREAADRLERRRPRSRAKWTSVIESSGW